jgi:hypothetical protein
LFLSRGKVFYNQSLIHTSKGNIVLEFPLEGCHILKHCVQKFITKQFETCKINLTPGIIDTQAPEKNIYVLNCGDQNVTIYPNMKLGTCESLYEQEPIKHEMCAKINISQKTNKHLIGRAVPVLILC